MATIRSSKIIQEILTTEKIYLHHLEKIVIYFSDEITSRNLIPSNIHDSIFGQLPSIYQMNCQLYEELSSGKQSIGECFLKLGPFLKVYSSYANNFQKSISILQKMETKRNMLKDFISFTETRPEVQSKLSALLITPIQRIPRYKLLLEELLKNTEESHSAYKDLEGALVKVREAADHINTSVSNAEILEQLLTLQKALRNQQPNIIVPGRKIIKDGLLNKVSRKGKGSQPRFFFLFSDIIMYTKVPLFSANSSRSSLALAPDKDLKPNSLECCCIMPLRYCRVTPVLGSEQLGITFRLQCSDEDLLLYSHSANEGHDWMEAIQSTAAIALKKRKTLRKRSSNRKAIRRPAFKKFSNSDDESNMDERTPIMSPNPNRAEILKSRFLQIKDCLTPPKVWSTPKRKKIEKLKNTKTTPLAAEANEFKNVSKENENFHCQRMITRRMSAKNSPRIVSPLAVYNSPKDAQLENYNHCSPSPYLAESHPPTPHTMDYNRGHSVTLRNKYKEQHLKYPSPNSNLSNATASNSSEKNTKKRPLSNFLSPNIFRYKRRKKESTV